MLAVVADNQDQIASLCEEFGVERLEIFGSAATDKFDSERSDLDFIVAFRADHDLGPWLQQYFAFRGALADLFARPVDLVMASAMTNPYFVNEANRTRQLLYGR